MATKDPPNTPSRSRSITKTVNGSHEFSIKGYSLAKGMGVGKYMSSETFTVGNYKWAIYFYPDGKNAEDNSQYVSLFIALASEGQDVRALFELTMKDQSGRGRHKVHSHFDRALESGPYTLKYRGSMWGYKRFFRRATLETSDFLKDDALQITCTVGVVVTETEGPSTSKTVSIPVPPSRMGMDFEALLRSEEGSDVSFAVGDEVMAAHKVILAARSPVLKAMLYGPLRERREGNIPVADIEPAVFRSLLHFIYTDNLPSTDPSPLSPIMAQHLLAAADRYALDRLRLICESKLCETVDVDTVCTTLALAEQHNAERLKKVCLTFAATQQNLPSVIRSDGFEHLRVSCPSLQAELLQTVAGVGNNSEIISRTDRSVINLTSSAAVGGGGAGSRAVATGATAAGTGAGAGAGIGAGTAGASGAGAGGGGGGGSAAGGGDGQWDEMDGSDPSGRRVRLRLGPL